MTFGAWRRLRSWPALRIALALIPLVGSQLHTAGWVRWEAVDRLDAVLQDVRLRSTMSRAPDPRVVIVDIDERHQVQPGAWPWSGERLATLADELFDRQQVAIVGFDLVFEAPGPAHGEVFARALRDRPVVLGYRFGQEAGEAATGVLPAPVLRSDSLRGHPVHVLERSSYTANAEALARAAPAAGFLDVVPDADGQVRSVPLLTKYQDQYHEAFALAMFRMMSGSPNVEPGFPADAQYPALSHGLESLQLRQGADVVLIPLSDRARVQVPFRAPGVAFRHIPVEDLMTGRLPAAQLQGLAVIVSLTGPGLGKRIATPVGDNYTRSELQASLLSGLLDERLPVRPDSALGYGLLTQVGAGLLLAMVLPLLSVRRAVALYAAVMAGIVGLNLWLYLAADLVLPLAPALLMATVTLALSLGYGFWIETLARRELSTLLGGHVPRAMVQALVRDPRINPARAVSRPLTVLFCDIRGFTGLAEQMEPADVQRLLSSVLSRMSQVILAHGGTIDKYMGDCVMAFWGAPVATPDHARRAVEAAQNLLRTVDVFNEERLEQGLVPLTVGIGINTGPMCVGDMGAGPQRTYTVIGDAVNLASRLQGLSAAYGVGVLAGEDTRLATGDFTWQELDRVRVRGRAHAVTLFTPLPLGVEQDKAVAEELRLWTAFLKAYRLQDWPSCERILSALLRSDPARPLYALYAQRVAAMRDGRGDPGWGGVAPAATL